MLKYRQKIWPLIETNILYEMFLTTDKIIRAAFRKILDQELEKYKVESGHPAHIFEELGIRHGMVRIDLAMINGIMHGYEIKSDRDTLERLPEQMREYNNVFDKMTLVVGNRHLSDAINLIPEWWGIIVAKQEAETVSFYTIREAAINREQKKSFIAQLLWREEALQILEEQNEAHGLRSKTRDVIYEKLAHVTDTETLKKRVMDTLLVSSSRAGWRSGA